MTIASMTGFARADGDHEGARWHWEIKSVNGRALDIRVRLPAGFDELEPAIREHIAAQIRRGNITAALDYTGAPGEQRLVVNESLLGDLIETAERIRAEHDLAPPRPDALLAIKGVCDIGAAALGEAYKQARDAAVIASLDEAMSRLVKVRLAEGAELGRILGEQLAEIGSTVSAARKLEDTTPAAIADRLHQRIAEVLDDPNRIDPDRLAQEIALLASKADIREEIDRLEAHVGAAQELLESAEPVGRQLDFLGQEMMREANTLSAKAASPEMKQTGLALKNMIDQFREQCQNVE